MSKRTIIFITVIAVVRGFLSAILQLHPDEAYYWLFSRRLALSYYDHPPMVAYLIRLSTFFSDHEFFVRFFGIFAVFFLSFLVYRLAQEIFHSETVSFWSVVVLNVFPVTSAGFVITPDVPLFIFYGLSVFLFWKIVSAGEMSSAGKYWIYLGVSSGLALLSKYTSVLLAPCIILFLAISRRHRFWLKTIYPYLTAIIATVVFLPVIIWNYQNDWASFKFQWERGVVGAGSFENLLMYLGGQIASGGIFLFLIGIVASIAFLFQRDFKKKFLVAMTLPVFLFFGWAGYKKVGEMNWPAPAFFTLSIIIAVFLFENKSKWKVFIGKLSIGFCAAVILIFYLHLLFGIIPVSKFNKTWALMDVTNRFYGWKEFAKEIERISAGSPIIAIDYQSASKILYYSDMKSRVYAGTNNFTIWQKNIKNIDGRCIAFDYSTDVISGPVDKNKFEKIISHKIFEVKRNGEVIRTFNIYECENFEGF